ncbi:MAG: MFS transporter [Bacteroidetes bacterium]|nr:MFS transporter [Bacteroidota bacterium]
MLINRMGTMVLPFMTLYLTQARHYSIGKAGLVVSIFGLGSICGGFLGGKFTDKFGFYFLQIFSLIGGGILFIALGQMESFPAICITTFILSMVNDAFRPANAAAIAHYCTEENRTRSYSLNRLAINLGWAAGGALGGFIASKNYQLLFWIDGLTNISAAFLLWLRLAPSKNTATAKKPIVKDANARSAYKDKPYIAFILLSVMYSFCFFQFFTTMPVFYREGLHLTETEIGLLMAFNGIGIVLFEMVAVHKLEGRKHILRYITMGVFLTSFSFTIFNILPGAGLIALASMAIATIGEILSMPFMNTFWISRSSDSTRGQYAGLYTICWSTAQVIGPTTGSQIAEKWGFNTLWWMIGGVCIASAIGYRWLYLKINKTDMSICK